MYWGICVYVSVPVMVYVHMCGMCPRVHEGTCCGIGTFFLIPHDGDVPSLDVCGGCHGEMYS